MGEGGLGTGGIEESMNISSIGEGDTTGIGGRGEVIIGCCSVVSIVVCVDATD